MCQACQIKIVPKSEVPQGAIGIELKGIVNDKFANHLAYIYCLAPEKVKAAFKEKTNLDIDETILSKLVAIHANGNDVIVYKVNFMDLIGRIKPSHEEKKKGACNIYLTT